MILLEGYQTLVDVIQAQLRRKFCCWRLDPFEWTSFGEQTRLFSCKLIRRACRSWPNIFINSHRSSLSHFVSHAALYQFARVYWLSRWICIRAWSCLFDKQPVSYWSTVIADDGDDKTKEMMKLFVLLFSFFFVHGLEPIVEQTIFGPVKGTWLRTAKGRLVGAFRGIPYAQPPIGPLRFKV